MVNAHRLLYTGCRLKPNAHTIFTSFDNGHEVVIVQQTCPDEYPSLVRINKRFLRLEPIDPMTQPSVPLFGILRWAFAHERDLWIVCDNGVLNTFVFALEGKTWHSVDQDPGHCPPGKFGSSDWAAQENITGKGVRGVASACVLGHMLYAFEPPTHRSDAPVRVYSLQLTRVLADRQHANSPWRAMEPEDSRASLTSSSCDYAIAFEKHGLLPLGANPP